VYVNDQKFTARRGDVLLDAALVNGVDMPHDCRSGHCGTCQVTVVKGLAIGGEGSEAGTVRACQARVITDLEVLVEPVPEVVTTRGILTGVRPVAPDVMEVRIAIAKPLTYLPGQYYKFRFQGYPVRCFSPTWPMAGPRDDTSVRLHVRRVTGGQVSSALGAQIGNGHPLRIEGPFGNAYLRPEQQNRLVLVASGTGFAPIWSIACAALTENLYRHIAIVVGARKAESLYMGQAMRQLREAPNVVTVPVVEEIPQGVRSAIRKGRPTDHMPELYPDDVVYACGSPKMVDAVRERTAESGAMFYADAFVPQTSEADDGMFSKAVDLIRNILPPGGRPGAKALPAPERFQQEAQSPQRSDQAGGRQENRAISSGK
jgi:3-phenylpropionate/trans-cinnamate dioxygenase ferredoxin reductase subunit